MSEFVKAFLKNNDAYLIEDTRERGHVWIISKPHCIDLRVSIVSSDPAFPLNSIYELDPLNLGDEYRVTQITDVLQYKLLLSAVSQYDPEKGESPIILRAYETNPMR
ncbi:hypothetical protein IC617_03915 [Neiella sp. HB171785]|uniref:Uncharacterized protein n=1 Tax=Neiella litorisoli TaxID=2771431 RepID=A0A8J6QFQ1_9GAMM|nr:hypothetical protein [Neiella litorisoli]MBD1388565.1 hypothetical protein [Neiella litorisoli]